MRPNFEKLIPLFQSNENFSLTETQYKKSTGVSLPKDYRYLKNRSALAKIAKKHGYVIEIQEKTICLKIEEEKQS